MTRKDHRNTALLVAGVLAVLACWTLYRGKDTAATVLGGIAAALVVTGLFVPPAAAAFDRVWMGVTHVLGYVNSRILMSLAYFIMITPIGLIMRLLGRDPLGVRAPGESESYWKLRNPARQTRQGFERSF